VRDQPGNGQRAERAEAADAMNPAHLGGVEMPREEASRHQQGDGLGAALKEFDAGGQKTAGAACAHFQTQQPKRVGGRDR